MSRILTHFIASLVLATLTSPAFGAAATGEKNCSDGIDNDNNGATDCDDARCQTSPACQEDGNCGDGIDNDDNGLADCDDEACHDTYDGCWQQICAEPTTTDGIFYALVVLANGTFGSVHCEVLFGVASCRTSGVGPDGRPLLVIGPPLCGG